MLRMPDYLIVAAYFTLMIVIGYLFRKFASGARAYFTAGNVMPWWLAGTSYFMVSFSTMLFLIYNEIAYTYGVVAFTITWVHGATMIAAGMIFAHRWRRARVVTPLGFMERRYDRSAHQLFVWSGFPLRMIDNGLRIYATSIVVVTAFGFAGHPNQNTIFITILAIISAVCIIYTVLGGQAAVIVSEFVQAIVILIAIYLVTHLCLARFDSFSDFWGRLPAGHKQWTRPPYDWTYLVFSTLIISFMNYSAGWALVQKFNTVRSEQDARKMVWLVTFLKMITPPLFFLPGLVAVVLMPDLKNPRYAFSEISFSLLPIGLIGFLLAAMFSATTSTLGAEYNTLSGIITRDFYKRILRPEATEKQQMFIGKMATIIIGLLTMIIAVLIEYIPQLNLMDIMKRTFAAFGPPIFIPLFMGLVNRRFNAFGVWLGVIFGATLGFFGGTINIWLISIFREEMSDPTVDYWLRGAFNSIIVVVNCLAVLFGMWLGSTLRPMSPGTRRRVDEFFEDLKQPFLIDRNLKGVESPFRLIGATTAIFGAAMLLVSFLILFVYTDEPPHAFKLNFFTALLLIALGLGMRYFSSRGRKLVPSETGEANRADT